MAGIAAFNVFAAVIAAWKPHHRSVSSQPPASELGSDGHRIFVRRPATSSHSASFGDASSLSSHLLVSTAVIVRDGGGANKLPPRLGHHALPHTERGWRNFNPAADLRYLGYFRRAWKDVATQSPSYMKRPCASYQRTALQVQPVDCRTCTEATRLWSS